MHLAASMSRSTASKARRASDAPQRNPGVAAGKQNPESPAARGFRIVHIWCGRLPQPLRERSVKIDRWAASEAIRCIGAWKMAEAITQSSPQADVGREARGRHHAADGGPRFM